MFDARLGGNGRLLAHSRTPFFDAARALLGDGADPAAWLTMMHAGRDDACLRARLGIAAKLTVEESAHGPVARSWRPASPSAVVASPMRSRGRGGGALAGVRP
jgi:hypothetical protein